METRIDTCLLLVRNWARERVDTGREPPWAWYQYMKLMEAVDQIRRGRANVTPLGEGSPGSEQSSARGPEKTGGVPQIETERSLDSPDGDPPPKPK
jgi:hypothetical protein